MVEEYKNSNREEPREMDDVCNKENVKDENAKEIRYMKNVGKKVRDQSSFHCVLFS